MSYGHAYALAVLGFEEIAKANMMIDAFMGIRSREELEDILRNHLSKQNYQWNEIASYINFEWFEQLQKSQQKKLLKTISEESVLENREKFHDIVKKTTQMKNNEYLANLGKRVLEIDKIIQLLLKEPHFLNRKKMNGLYVDIDLFKVEITSPKNFTFDDLEFIKTVECMVQFTKDWLNDLKKALANDQTRKLIANFQAFFAKVRSKVFHKEKINND